MTDSFSILKLTDQQVKIHKSIYLEKISELENVNSRAQQEIYDRNNEIKQYKLLLHSLDKVEASPSHNGCETIIKESRLNSFAASGMEYDSGWSAAKKCEFVLSKTKKQLSTRELINSILDLEPDLLKRKEITFDRFQKNLGSTLLQKIQRKDVFFREAIGGEYKYGLIKQKEKYVTK